MDSVVVTNHHDAERVARVGDLFADVLLELDPRVQGAYTAWRARMAAYEATDDWEAAYDAATGETATTLAALVRDLGLSHYRWLRQSLLFAFFRAVEGDPEIWRHVAPVGVPWAERGRAPKAGPKQREDLRRNVEWLYRVEVKQPPDPLYAIGKEYAADLPNAAKNSNHGTVQYGIARASALLACINAELPDTI